MSSATQQNRAAELTTPLGRDRLLLTRLDASEALSELFEFRIEALSETPGLDFEPVLGRNCAVEYRSYQGRRRYFCGVLAEAGWYGVRDGCCIYRMILRPWLWQLTASHDCRIFKKMSAPDIIKEVFSKLGFSDYRDALQDSYKPIEYCVQYRESAFQFVSRLMEHFGIYYFFEHTADKHVLVLADSRGSHQPVPGLASVPFVPTGSGSFREGEHLFAWSSERRFRTGKVTLNDFDFKKPNARLIASRDAGSGYEKGGLEVYDYPGRYWEAADGEQLARVRLEAAQAADQRRSGHGLAPSLMPGGTVALERHEVGSENTSYLVVRAGHSIANDDYAAVGGRAVDPYFGAYEFQRLDRPFRPPLVTPKPVIQGPQTAKVVGKEGEEIDVDEHGRILLAFHWDRDKTPSRRVRVAQMWSGRSWGGIVTPRIGQEVVVEFLEGDPDRPLVTGTVYNGEYRHPYDLPSNKTMTGVKSESSKGGGGYNEFVLDDKKNAELVRMHAQKDHETVILDKETRTVGEKFTGAGASRATVLKKGDDTLKVETGHWKVKVAQTVVIDADVSIELRCGGSSLFMDPKEIKLKSSLITVEANAKIEEKAPAIEIKGAATVKITGGVVFIN